MVTRADHRPDVDGLRAVAVVAVITNHLAPTLLPGGFLGVDLFFVISGYAVAHATLCRARNGGDVSMLAFYERRIRRLLPALVVAVFAGAILSAALIPAPAFSLRTGAAALLGAANLYLLKQSADYFAPTAELNFFTHTWSLGVEEQFYLFFPLAFRAVRTSPRRAGLVLALAGIGSGAAFLVLARETPDVAYYSMPARLWELAMGGLALAVVERKKSIPRAGIIGGLAGLALFITLALPVSPGLGAPVVVLASFFVLVCAPPGALLVRVLSRPSFARVGILSYSLYLWHWVWLVGARWSIGLTAAAALVVVTGTWLSAELSYRVVEQPLRHAQWSRHRLGTIGIAAGVIGVFVAALLTLSSTAGPTLRALGAAAFPPAYSAPTIVQHDNPCHLPKTAADPFATCLAPTADGGPTIYVVGDSHSSNHVDSIRAAVAATTAVKVRSLVEWGLILELQGRAYCGTRRPCLDHSIERHVDFLRRALRPGDTVVFSWARDEVLRRGPLPRAPDAERMAALERGLRQLIAVTTAARARFLLVDDIPKPCAADVDFVAGVLTHGDLDRCRVPIGVSRADRRPLTELYTRLVGPGVDYFDPHDTLCDADSCGVVHRGTTSLLYGDASPHLSREHARDLATVWTGVLVPPQPASAPTP